MWDRGSGINLSVSGHLRRRFMVVYGRHGTTSHVGSDFFAWWCSAGDGRCGFAGGMPLVHLVWGPSLRGFGAVAIFFLLLPKFSSRGKDDVEKKNRRNGQTELMVESNRSSFILVASIGLNFLPLLSSLQRCCIIQAYFFPFTPRYPYP